MKIQRHERGGWIVLGYLPNIVGSGENLIGKYLFFSPDRKRLIELAEYELNNHNFGIAKVSINPSNKDHVLCLYWEDDSRKDELARRYFFTGPTLKYRYWKSNEDTRRGKYSNQYVDAQLAELMPSSWDNGDFYK